MTQFPTAAHLVSWAGLAPVARQSGPRQRKPKKGQGDGYLKGYCTQASLGASRTGTFLGERFRRLSRRTGGVRAQCAAYSGPVLGQVAGARCRSPAPSRTGEWAPSLPRDQRCSRKPVIIPGPPPAALPRHGSYRPGHSRHPPGAASYETSVKGSRTFARPAFPSPVAPG